MSEYTEQAEQFIKKHELEFRAVLVGDDCPLFCEDAEKQNAMDQVNVYPRKTHIHGKHYRCTFSRKGKGHFTVDFWNSYADEEYKALGSKKYRESYHHGESMFRRWDTKRVPNGRGGIKIVNDMRNVQAYDVLACIQKSDPGTFHDFAGEFGYDEDSRKAEQVYQAVVKEWERVRRFFTADEIEELQEIN